MTAALVMYVPVLHASYLEFFAKHKADKLYIVSQEVIDLFPRIKREIRAIKPDTMLQLLNFLPHVESIGLAELQNLGTDSSVKVTMPDEEISYYLKEHYLPKAKLVPFFLRFDEKTVRAARKEAPFSGQISAAEFDRKIFHDLNLLKVKNSDWFLQVSAALIIDKKVVEKDINKRLPTPHAMWTLGDPRNYLDYGSDTHQRTSIHAEQAVIAHAARDGVKVEGASMYVTAFPCPDCCQVIAESGIKKVYFVDGYSQLSSTEVFDQYEIEVIKVVQSDQKKPAPGQKAQ